MAAGHLNFSLDEYRSRINKTQSEMHRHGLDTLIVVDTANMAWLTGYDGFSFYVHQAVVVPAEGDPIWFGRGIDITGAKQTTWLSADNIVGYSDDYVQSADRHPMQVLCDLLKERQLGKGVVGVEMDNYWYTAAAHGTLKGGLAGCKFIDATGLVNWQRAIKSPQEISFMRNAARIADLMHERIIDKIEPGMRKCDLVAEIYDASIRGTPDFGGDYCSVVPILPSGAEAAAVHLTWNDKPLRKNEGTYFELCGVYKRYHVPVSRTVFLGQPPQKFLDAEKATLEGLEAGLAVAKPGNICEDVALAFGNVLAKFGLKKSMRVGYPVGLSYPPDIGERTMSLRRGDRTVLEPGMTFHFMTGLWFDDWGFAITETMLITPAGAECLANVPRKLFVKD